jgi:hypothetical protein
MEGYMRNGFVTVRSRARIFKTLTWDQKLEWKRNPGYGLSFELWWQNSNGSTETKTFNPVHCLIDLVRKDTSRLYYQLSQDERLRGIAQTHQFLRTIRTYRTWEFQNRVLDPEALSWKIEVDINEHHEEIWRVGVTVEHVEDVFPIWVSDS